ncbi:MAG: stage II sporulation protein M [Gammaproteobacteria bacterium]
MENNGDTQALAHWLSTRRDNWVKLENKLDKRRTLQGQEAADARAVLTGYRSLLADLSLARRINRTGPVTRYLENLFLKVHEEIYRTSVQLRFRLVDLYHLETPLLMRRMSGALLAAVLIFSLSILAGWLLVSAYPELAGLFASPQMIEQVQSGRLWTDGLLNIAPSSLLSIGIAANNITVTLFAFALGALYGVGTLYIIGMNGLMLGGILAFTASYGLDKRLLEFIIGHGVVELSVILIAGAMGLRLGEALIRPGQRNRLQAFQDATMNAGKVLLAAVPFLIAAALIEGFVSPDPRFGLFERATIGICSGTVFWLIMLFGLPGRHREITRRNER